MGRYNPDEYEMVEERLKRFYEDHPNGRILTELASDPNDREFAMFKAEVWIDFETLVSTGYAQEIAGQSSPVNRTSHLENAETSAIGRGLANYQYSGKKRPSREEMAKTQGPPTKEEPAQPFEDDEIDAPAKTEGKSVEEKFQLIAANKDKFAPEVGKMMNHVLELVQKKDGDALDEIIKEYGIGV